VVPGSVTADICAMLRLRTLGRLSLHDAAGIEHLAGRRKELILLTYLARRSGHTCTRAELAELLWSDRSEDKARHSLRQALANLRAVLAAALDTTGDEVHLGANSVRLDVDDLIEQLSREGIAPDTSEWRQDFLAGTEHFGGEGYRAWVEAEREGLRRQLTWHFERLHADARREMRRDDAVRWATRWAELRPYDERPHLLLVEALHDAGRTADALAHHEVFVRGLRHELEIEPSDLFLEKAREIETRMRERWESSAATSSGGAGHAAAEASSTSALTALPGADSTSNAVTLMVEEPLAHAHPRRGRPHRLLMVAAPLLIIAGATLSGRLLLSRNSTANAASPVLAVGMIRALTTQDSADPSGSLSAMLSTNLARVAALRVVSPERLYEALPDPPSEHVTARAVASAARRAGAQQLIEGELYQVPDSGFRLDLRRVDLGSGTVRAGYRVTGTDLFALVDQGTARLAADLGSPADEVHIADVITRNTVALRFYEEGLRGYKQGDMRRAESLFRAALDEDSTFALAAYYAYVAGYDLGMPSDVALETRLLSLLDQMPERERRFMRARLALRGNEPSAVALAESLTSRYPLATEGPLLLGQALATAGALLEAIPPLRKVVVLDSLELRSTSPVCRACDAYDGLIGVLDQIDSTESAEREARQWVRRQPTSARSWGMLAHHLAMQGRFDEAQAARNQAATYDPANPYNYVFPGMLAIMRGDFPKADALLREQARAGTPSARSDALWFLVISLRYQGRFAEALEVVRQFQEQESDDTPGMAHGQVLFEMGRYRQAAAVFRELADSRRGGPLRRTDALVARDRAWLLTHMATALAAAGDTGQLQRVADSVEALGARSLYGRDRRLHHYVRGLLFAARNAHADAADEFAAAMDWPPASFAHYNRTNLELARQLLELGRPGDAIRPLQRAILGPVESSYYYVSRTELHALLGRAFEATGQVDSAARHLRWAVEAWRKPDRSLLARRDSLRALLAGLGPDRRAPN
jgi:DNA-binding SARP family transcriptional activator/tetratricopeptide (TPR) repeat protein